jgi:hypothetical protein
VLTRPCYAWNQDDLSELLSTFNAHGVEYLVVGAHELAAHGHVRSTSDLEVWVRPSAKNPRVLRVRATFGAPVEDLLTAISRRRLIFQIGNAPMRIDVINAIDRVVFPAAWRQAPP